MVKINDKTFGAFLINCGADIVEVLTLRTGTKPPGLTHGGSIMVLRPQIPLLLGSFKFMDFRGYIFECSLTIEAKPKGKLALSFTYINLT
jgi:hypothetical protein